MNTEDRRATNAPASNNVRAMNPLFMARRLQELRAKKEKLALRRQELEVEIEDLTLQRESLRIANERQKRRMALAKSRP
ncbi:MAG: hypothetical protein MUE60_11865 [Candidatus Eisenbacteria bacterium]|jgi:hypothetical protein|nr:hypothetical protein [Candidatus Eisenbacteria bacterium]